MLADTNHQYDARKFILQRILTFDPAADTDARACGCCSWSRRPARCPSLEQTKRSAGSASLPFTAQYGQVNGQDLLLKKNEQTSILHRNLSSMAQKGQFKGSRPPRWSYKAFAAMASALVHSRVLIPCWFWNDCLFVSCQAILDLRNLVFQ
jgi:hypothetical protein